MKKHIVALFLVFVMTVNAVGCGGGYQIKAENLMDGVKGEDVIDSGINGYFLEDQMAFALDLFQRSVSDSDSDNVLISPISVMLVLSMVANGANEETKAEMEAVLGMPVEELNEYLYSYVRSLPSSDVCKMEIANSIWFRSADFTVNPEFLQNNADYYGAGAYQAPFDETTVKDINHWVNDRTDGLIEKMVDKIDPDMMMYLINTVLFDAKWNRSYKESQINDGVFTSYKGQERDVQMMTSKEYSYISLNGAVGFEKAYRGGDYRFAALLPDEDTDIYDYIASLDSGSLLEALDKVQPIDLQVEIPQFAYSYELTMNKILQDMGMKSAFNGAEADFSGISDDTALYIGQVLQKSYISVDDKGTKAVSSSGAGMTKNEDVAIIPEIIVLDRPFVYMIIDSMTNLPIFMGVVTDIGV